MSSNKTDYQWKFEFSCVLIVFLIIGLLFSWTKNSKLSHQVEDLTTEIATLQYEYSQSEISEDDIYDSGYSDGEHEGYINGLSDGFSKGQLVGIYLYRYDGLLLGITGDYRQDYFYSLYTDSDSDLSFRKWIDLQISEYYAAYDHGYPEGKKAALSGHLPQSFGGPDMPTVEDIGHCAGYYDGYLDNAK